MADRGKIELSRRVLRASPLSIGITVVIAAVSVFGFAFTRHSAEQQERSVLASDTNQAALYAGSIFSEVGGLLDSLATGVSLSYADPAQFTKQASLYAEGSSSLVLARADASGRYEVVASAGPAFTPGQVLSAPLSTALSGAGARFSPTGVVFNGRTSTAGFAVGPPLVPPGLVVYMQIRINPFLPSQATAARSFSMLDAALYGASRPTRSALLVATAQEPPSGPDASVAHTAVGTGTWTLVASARTPLTGGFASLAPFIILFLGLIIALSVGAVIEMLHRRHRFAAAMVAARTSELERSLAELRDAQRALVRAERLAAVGEMASVVGHELRNPLAAVTNAFYLMRRALGDPAPVPVEKHLAMAERETAKAASLAEDLVAFVRPRQPRKEPVDLADIVDEVLEATPAPLTVSLDVDVEHVAVEADPRQLAEVLTNLVTNAYQAITGSAETSGSVRIEGHMNGAGAVLSVQDSGPGIEAALAERVFEPFFTTKHDGTGLGLAIVRRLIEAHDGEVSVENRTEATGLRVQVRLPVAASAPEPAALAVAEGHR